MSKYLIPVLLSLPLILQTFNNCAAQTSEVVISISQTNPAAAVIHGRTERNNSRNFSLIRDIAGTSNLADRVSEIGLEDSNGKPVAYKQFVPGEYVAESNFSAWNYRIDLSPSKLPAAAAHTSWIGNDSGLLFFEDLLPTLATNNGSSVSVNIKIPADWQIFGNGSSLISNASKSTVFLAKRPRVSIAEIKNGPLLVVTSGEWNFTDKQVVDLFREIYNEYYDIFGGAPSVKKELFLLPFPNKVSAGNWEADTRGHTVTLLSSDATFASQSVQRLHEQLRHELFHLWFPNGVNLTGNYDWFYEGFALYESLKLGVALNRLRFDDYLDTLGRAMTIDAAIADRRSLLDASATRMTGNDTILYARGMLAAYLADIETIQRSGGKEDVSTILRRVYQEHRFPATAEDGNAVVLKAVHSPAVTAFVSGNEKTNWIVLSEVAGMDVNVQTGATTLSVTAKPTSSQKRFLDKLGYNNWRKLPAVIK
jgi:hypothetical protein